MSITNRNTYKKERQFGWLIAGFLLAVCLYHYLKDDKIVSITFVIAGVTIFITFIYPASLKFLLLVWKKISYWLALVNTVILLCIVYFLIILPIGLIFRLIGREVLNILSRKTRSSYWEIEEKVPASFKNQF